MKILNFRGSKYRELLNLVDGFMKENGFKLCENIVDSRTNMLDWKKALAPTLFATASFSINSALGQQDFFLEVTIFIESSYVADMYKKLSLAEGCRMSTFLIGDTEILIGFVPTNIRWKENTDVQYSSLEGCLDSLEVTKAELAETFVKYVNPYLSMCLSPTAVADFQLRADTEFLSKRLGKVVPRFRVHNDFVSTALLLHEDGDLKRALLLVENAKVNRQRFESYLGAGYLRRIFCELEKLSLYLNGQLCVK